LDCRPLEVDFVRFLEVCFKENNQAITRALRKHRPVVYVQYSPLPIS
jgi:hypothetical protein